MLRGIRCIAPGLKCDQPSSTWERPPIPLEGKKEQGIHSLVRAAKHSTDEDQGVAAHSPPGLEP